MEVSSKNTVKKKNMQSTGASVDGSTFPNICQQKTKTVLIITASFAVCFFISNYNFTIIIRREPDFKEFKLYNENLEHKNNTERLISSAAPKTDFGSAISTDRKRYICPKYQGRLGNIMFIYASSYGLAFDHDITFIVSSKHELHKGFANIPIQDWEEKCKGKNQLIAEKFPRIYQNISFSQEQTIYRLQGFFQSWKYFRHSFDDLRHQFTFKDDIKKKVESALQNLIHEVFGNKTDVVTVGIHVRRDDYVTEYRTVPNKTFFDRAKMYFTNKYSNVLFIISTSPNSKDKQWCSENIILDQRNVVPFGLTDKFEDMAMLSMTDHVITSVGTFSWWSGFLNKGTVIFYDWITDNHPRFKRADYIMPNWIGLKP